MSDQSIEQNGTSVSYANQVLIADDDLFIRSLVKKILGSFIDVKTLQGSSDVLDYYKRIHPAVVMLDVHLPKKSGLALLDEILSYDLEAYVIIVSGDSTKENVIEAKRRGAKSFIAKPFHRQKLMGLIHQCSRLKMKQYF